MMKFLSILAATAATTQATKLGTFDEPSTNAHRELSGDVISFDDDFWSYNTDVDVSKQTIWTDYSFKPTKCMV